FAGSRIQVGVGAQPLVHLAAEQVVHRLADRLADDVPAGHLQPAHHAHETQVRTQREPGAVALAPEALDLERVATGEAAGEQILDHARDDLRPERGGVHLAEALYAAARAQLEEYEVATAEGGRWIGNDEYLDAVELHSNFLIQDLALMMSA